MGIRHILDPHPDDCPVNTGEGTPSDCRCLDGYTFSNGIEIWDKEHGVFAVIGKLLDAHGLTLEVVNDYDASAPMLRIVPTEPEDGPRS